MLGNSAVVASSIPPCAALLQVRAHAPDRVLELAHALQRAHFEDGEDLNDPALYARLLAAAGIDLSIELPPVDRSPPALAEEFRAVRALGGTSFPTVMVRRPASLETLPISYDPPTWIDTVTEALGPGQWR